jgi:radical SAM protein with 4Fe4S-binding SPASM domain
MMRGDGSYKNYIQKNKWDLFKIRLALKDEEPINYIEEISKEIGIEFYNKPFRNYKKALFTNKRKDYELILKLIEENINKNSTKEYASGYLAGIYDAEGHIRKTGMITISNTDKKIIDEISKSLELLKIPFKIDEDKNGTKNKDIKYRVRTLSNKEDRSFIKFIKFVNPKIKRKGIINILNKSLMYNEEIKEINFVGKTTVYNLETSTSTYIANNICVHNCYYANYGKDLFQGKMPKKNNILTNIDKMMNFIYKNNMFVDIELFAGECFMLPYIWDVLNIIHKYLKKMPLEKRSESIMIPTNMSILKDGNEDKYKKYLKFVDKFEKIGVKFLISASVDGPFMDYINRPQLNKDNRKYNGGFYKRLKNEMYNKRIGIHPMIHNGNIDYWIDNLLWFLNTSNEKLPGVYLLEVRNAQWSEEEALSLHYFLRSIPNLLFKKVGFSLNEFDRAFKALNGFNILYSPFVQIGRGMGCSLQSGMHIQVDSLKFSPCHRTSYDNFVTCQFEFNKDGSYDLKSKNIETFIAEQATDTRTLTPCSTCPINELCTGPCLGASYEAVGDMFIIPPTLCRMFYLKYSGILLGLRDVGYLDRFLNSLRNKKKILSQIKHILNISEQMLNGEHNERK